MPNSNNKEEVKAEICPACGSTGRVTLKNMMTGVIFYDDCYYCEPNASVSSTAETSEHELDKARADQLEDLYIASQKDLEQVRYERGLYRDQVLEVKKESEEWAKLSATFKEELDNQDDKIQSLEAKVKEQADRIHVLETRLDVEGFKGDIAIFSKDLESQIKAQEAVIEKAGDALMESLFAVARLKLHYETVHPEGSPIREYCPRMLNLINEALSAISSLRKETAKEEGSK